MQRHTCVTFCVQRLSNHRTKRSPEIINNNRSIGSGVQGIVLLECIFLLTRIYNRCLSVHCVCVALVALGNNHAADPPKLEPHVCVFVTHIFCLVIALQSPHHLSLRATLSNNYVVVVVVFVVVNRSIPMLL